MSTLAADLDLFKAIDDLKRERNAVLLAHYYQDPDIQDIADYLGDSLGLSQQAATTTADVIVFAGVHFMAETAKILSPEKTVVVPDILAGCSLADSCPADAFQRFIEQNPGHIVVTYVNTSAAVKALSDICVTSTNAERIIRQIPPEQPIIFGPDQHLGRYLIKQTGRDMLLWPGSCMVHESFSARRLMALKLEHPGSQIIAHPECEAPILDQADFIGSTSALLKYVRTAATSTFIVATEEGIIHQMKKAAPTATFIPAPIDTGACVSCSQCPHMRLNTLEKIYLCLRDLQPEVSVPEAIIDRARLPIQRMLDMS